MHYCDFKASFGYKRLPYFLPVPGAYLIPSITLKAIRHDMTVATFLLVVCHLYCLYLRSRVTCSSTIHPTQHMAFVLCFEISNGLASCRRQVSPSSLTSSLRPPRPRPYTSLSSSSSAFSSISSSLPFLYLAHLTLVLFPESITADPNCILTNRSSVLHGWSEKFGTLLKDPAITPPVAHRSKIAMGNPEIIPCVGTINPVSQQRSVRRIKSNPMGVEDKHVHVEDSKPALRQRG